MVITIFYEVEQTERFRRFPGSSVYCVNPTRPHDNQNNVATTTTIIMVKTTINYASRGVKVVSPGPEKRFERKNLVVTLTRATGRVSAPRRHPCDLWQSGRNLVIDGRRRKTSKTNLYDNNNRPFSYGITNVSSGASSSRSKAIYKHGIASRVGP